MLLKRALQPVAESVYLNTRPNRTGSGHPRPDSAERLIRLEDGGVDERERQSLAHVDLAFAGVDLGDGVSMNESQVIDDDGTAGGRRVAREPDEIADWRRLVDDPDLTVYFSIGFGGPSFLDAVGVRFHLPACLYRAVRDFDEDGIGNMFESLYYLLTALDDYTLGRKQKDALRSPGSAPASRR